MALMTSRVESWAAPTGTGSPASGGDAGASGRGREPRRLRAAQDGADDVPRVVLVVDDQDRLARQRRELRAHFRFRRDLRPLAHSGEARPRLEHRQLDGERCAASFPFTVRGDGAAVKLDELPYDGQAEADAAVRARRRAVGLAEGLEERGEGRRGGAHTS